MRTPWLLIFALAALLRLPYLDFPVQGDDAFYLAMAQQALVNPAHPNHFEYIAQGTRVDMRGFPKPPGNAWILAGGIVAGGGEVREPLLHGIYAGFTVLALWAVWRLALVFCALPHWAVALFAAVPAFVINGNSLEADLPFVALLLAALACLVRGGSRACFGLAAVCGGAAALIEYKTIFLVPLAGWYVWRHGGAKLQRNAWAWLAVLAPALVLAGWQGYERWQTGAAGAEVLAGYFQSRNLQSGGNKLRNAVALTVHLGWMMSPILAAGWFGRVEWAVAAVAALGGAALHDASPLFWLPLGLGLAILSRALRGLFGFVEVWLVGFFAFALLVFFAGSARYLLPAAAPLAFLTVNRLAGRSRNWLAAGLGLHLALSLSLNHANFEMWSTYRRAVAQWQKPLGQQRSWVAGDWGLRFYAESAGAAPMRRGEAVRPGDVVVASRLGQTIEYTAGGGVAAPLGTVEARPWLPLRLHAMNSRSTYSTHEGGLRAFDIDSRPADVITAVQIVERAPVLSYLPMNAPEAAFQIASGAYSLEDNAWRWVGPRVVALVKRPERPARVAATFRIIAASPVRRARLLVDGVMVAEASFPGPGLFTIQSEKPIAAAGASVTVSLWSDGSFSPPNDARELAVILTGLGFAVE